MREVSACSFMLDFPKEERFFKTSSALRLTLLVGIEGLKFELVAFRCLVMVGRVYRKDELSVWRGFTSTIFINSYGTA